jgi:predicted secreted Zn-dependent protease
VWGFEFTTKVVHYRGVLKIFLLGKNCFFAICAVMQPSPHLSRGQRPCEDSRFYSVQTWRAGRRVVTAIDSNSPKVHRRED